jgi:hypothetical protein
MAQNMNELTVTEVCSFLHPAGPEIADKDGMGSTNHLLSQRIPVAVAPQGHQEEELVFSVYAADHKSDVLRCADVV